MTEKPAQAVVLGAGIAGLSAADMLARAGLDVTIVEATECSGGAHRSQDIGPYTFDAGSIFYEDAARLFDLAPGLRDMCPQVTRHQKRIDPSGALLHYPMAPRDILRWPWRDKLRAASDLIKARVSGRRDGTLDGICTARLGATIYHKTGLHAYIARLNLRSPDMVDETFFFHRMAFVERMTRIDRMFKSALQVRRKAPKDAKPRKPLRIRPVEGFAPLFTKIEDSLKARDVTLQFNAPLQRIETQEGRYKIHTGQGIFTADVVISALPLDCLHRSLFGESSGIETLDLMTLFVSAGRLSEETGNVLFNFDTRGRWKRATVYARLFADHPARRPFFAAEVTLPKGATPDPQAAFDDLSAHFGELGIADDLTLEGHTVVPDAYPIYAPGTAALRDTVLARVAQTGVIAVGRQGRFDYLPTSSGVINQVAQIIGASDLTPPLTKPDHI